MPTHTVSVNGTTLAVETCGSGLPLVLLHAFPLDHRMWQRVLPLADHLRLIIPDQRGFGGSVGGDDSTAEPASIGQLAEDVVGLLDALHVSEPAVIAGVSMGGYVAQQVAARHPDRVHSLILCDTKFAADTSEARAGRADLAARVGRVGQRILAEAMIPNLLAKAPTVESPSKRNAVEQLLHEMITRQPVATIQAALAALGQRPDMTAAMQQCDRPVLLICGAEDTITPPAVMQAMEELLPQGRLLVVPEAGHLVPLEAPEIFCEAVLAFLGLPVAVEG
ncbi:MAG: alpha/beta fold hydrolase [Planctomycetia bacterium]|jgi:pimeloyl-ACP methyl ester carboxylesterase|nr:alpha/beta fold hydrolase [Planctomycetia bacterium]